MYFYKVFRIELSCEWVDAKNLEFFHGEWQNLRNIPLIRHLQNPEWDIP